MPGVITTDDGWSYQLTDEDLDWASRMIRWEGGDNAATLWTMAQRLAMVRGSSFTNLIRAYSQPINPRWAVTGAKCAPGSPYFGTASCSGTALAHRAEAQAPPTRYPAELAFVQDWAAGRVPNPVPRAVEFANGPVSQHCIDTGSCTDIVMRAPASAPPERQNWYMATPQTASWGENHVRVSGAGAAQHSVLGPLLAVAGVLGAGVAVWYALEERRR